MQMHMHMCMHMCMCMCMHMHMHMHISIVVCAPMARCSQSPMAVYFIRRPDIRPDVQCTSACDECVSVCVVRCECVRRRRWGGEGRAKINPPLAGFFVRASHALLAARWRDGDALQR